MRVGESATLRGEPIEVRRRRVLCSVTRQVTVADVVGENEDDVGTFGGDGVARDECRQQNNQEATHCVRPS